MVLLEKDQQLALFGGGQPHAPAQCFMGTQMFETEHGDTSIAMTKLDRL